MTRPAPGTGFAIAIAVGIAFWSVVWWLCS